MVRSDEVIARLLLDAAVIDARQLAAARAQVAKWGGKLHHVIVEMGFAREDAVATAIAAGTRVPRVRLSTVPPDGAALSRLDATVCEERNVFPCALKDGGATLWLAVSDPTDEGLAHVVRATGVPRVYPVVAGFDEIQEAILRTYRGENRRRWAIGEQAKKTQPGVFGAPVPPPAKTPPGGWPVPRPEPSGSFGGVAGAGSISKSLDELLGLTGGSALGPAELQQLAVLKANQERMSKVLRVIVELCAERGVFTIQALKDRLR